MVRIRWTNLAVSELEDIYNFILPDSKQYAIRQVKRIRQRTKLLKRSKYIGHIVEEYGNPSVRELLEGTYRIIYRVISNSDVLILTVHHSSRELINRKIE